METKTKSNKPLRYESISLQRRIRLIQLVLGEKLSIRKASIELGINGSTAKLIVKRYKQNKTFFIRKEDKSKGMNLLMTKGLQVAQENQMTNKHNLQRSVQLSVNINQQEEEQNTGQQNIIYQNESPIFFYYLGEEENISMNNVVLFFWY